MCEGACWCVRVRLQHLHYGPMLTVILIEIRTAFCFYRRIAVHHDAAVVGPGVSAAMESCLQPTHLFLKDHFSPTPATNHGFLSNSNVKFANETGYFGIVLRNAWDEVLVSLMLAVGLSSPSWVEMLYSQRFGQLLLRPSSGGLWSLEGLGCWRRCAVCVIPCEKSCDQRESNSGFPGWKATLLTTPLSRQTASVTGTFTKYDTYGATPSTSRSF